MADEDIIRKVADCNPGSLGPVNLKLKIYADNAALQCADFVCGANEDDKHFTGVNWERDLPLAEAVDIRNIIEGDASPDGKGTLSIVRGIEVGHIFQLGKKYSESMNATVLNENGKAVTMTMGCYGIGVTRIVAAAIEQNHDDAGIIWPAPLAPFDVILVPINMHRSEEVRAAAEALYDELREMGLEVLFDDRNARPGVKFADAELLGIPHRLVISERSLAADELEYRHRRDSESRNLKRAQALELLQESSVSS